MTLSTTHLNPRLLDAEYAVRGPIVQRAQEHDDATRRIHGLKRLSGWAAPPEGDAGGNSS